MVKEGFYKDNRHAGRPVPTCNVSIERTVIICYLCACRKQKEQKWRIATLLESIFFYNSPLPELLSEQFLACILSGAASIARGVFRVRSLADNHDQTGTGELRRDHSTVSACASLSEFGSMTNGNGESNLSAERRASLVTFCANHIAINRLLGF